MGNLFEKAREIAHAAVAVIGVLAGSGALIVTTLQQFGVNISEAQIMQELGVAGVGAALLSKLIDSVHNAVTTNATPPTA